MKVKNSASTAPLQGDIQPFMARMPAVSDYQSQLTGLQGRWDTLALLAQLSGLKLDAQQIRDDFAALTHQLLTQLSLETFSSARSKLEQKAHAALDVLTRNLFERTADIGFLATDGLLVQFCEAHQGGTPQDPDLVTQRFAAYTSKYSVYKEAVLFDTQGHVLASLTGRPTGQSKAPQIGQALEGRPYVETFAAQDFLNNETALVYSAAVCSQGRPVGVLSLVFDAQSEVQAIFNEQASEDEVLVFLDADERVLFSSEPLVMPLGAKVPPCSAGQQIKLAARRLIAAKTSATHYQGYPGPGWSAMAVVPLDEAFPERKEDAQSIHFEGRTLFSEAALSIPKAAHNIQSELQRLVWNGRVQQSASDNQFAKALLTEIATIGSTTERIFEAAIENLRHTTVGALKEEASASAARCVDIADRNLYERACDVRWWAADPRLAASDLAACQTVLRSIHELYTVYQDLLLVDKQGHVLCSSRQQHEGETLDSAWLHEVYEPNARSYTVSAFEPSGLYDNKPTYVYACRIPNTERCIVIVFDSQPQFEAMLDAVALPHSGVMSALLTDDKRLLATRHALPAPLLDRLPNLVAGQRWNALLEVDGQVYVVGACAGQGYREFKRTDGYTETLVSVTAVPCGEVVQARSIESQPQQQVETADNPENVEVALFLHQRQWRAARTTDIEICVQARQMTAMPRQAQQETTLLMHEGRPLPVLGPLKEKGLVIVLKQGALRIGLPCEALGSVQGAKVLELDHISQGLAAARIGNSLVPMVDLTAAKLTTLSLLAETQTG